MNTDIAFLKDIALTFEGLKFVGLPGLIASVDFALFELLKGLDVVIIGLGITVGGLYALIAPSNINHSLLTRINLALKMLVKF